MKPHIYEKHVFRLMLHATSFINKKLTSDRKTKLKLNDFSNLFSSHITNIYTDSPLNQTEKKRIKVIMDTFTFSFLLQIS